MAYSSATWNQLKELTLEELAKALNGWTEERRSGATVGCIKTTGQRGLSADGGWCRTCIRGRALDPAF